ncbi:AraC family transcriptional regulator [Parabacteroides distasonis]|nr:AraC family transcriptional regulator [Parabacteroides distasonis]
MTSNNLPLLDLPVGFVVSTAVTEQILGFYKQTCRLKAGIFALCVSGTLKASINLKEYTLQPGDLVTLIPGSIIQFCEETDAVQLSFIGFSSSFMEGVNLIQSTTDNVTTIYEHPVLPLDIKKTQQLNDFLKLLERIVMEEGKINPEIVKHILQGLMIGIGDLYRGKQWPNQTLTRSDEIQKKFLGLVMKHYTSNRQTSFYASHLSISPQHLCMIVKQKTGRSVSDIIADMVIMDAKSQLKSTDLTIQEISYSLNFPNVSFFGKYFKRYVGVSPQKFRNS